MNYTELLAAYDKLEAERDVLAARVGRQKTYIDGLKCMIERYNEVVAKQCRKEAWHEDHPLVQVSTMTPTQCLRQIQADAGRAGFVAGYERCWRDAVGSRVPEFVVPFLSNEYANRVKAGEV